MQPRLPQSLTNITHSDAESNEERFQHLFQALPPELKAVIYEGTFSAVPSSQHISQTYKPPNILQIDQRTRHAFARLYYSQTTFKCANRILLRAWLSSLDPEYAEMILDIHLSSSNDEDDFWATRKPSAAAITEHLYWYRIRTLLLFKQTSRPRRKNDDSDYSRMLKAEARLLFALNFLRRFKINLKSGVLKVDVRFEGMEEEVWTAQPDRLFRKWKSGELEGEWRSRSGAFDAVDERGIPELKCIHIIPQPSTTELE